MVSPDGVVHRAHPAIAAASLLLGVLALAGLWWQAHLQPATAADTQLVILVAAKLGKTRLIDNITVNLAS